MSGEWKHSEGPIVSDHLFLGEVYDARKAMVGWRMRDYDDSNWAPLATTTFPYNKTAKMVSLMIPPITRRASFTPVAVTKSNQGWVFDLGVNMAGSCTLRINDASGIASPGDEVTMRHAEAVGPGGELIQTWLLGGAEQSKYIIRANSNSNAASEVWTPPFSYFGFRFVEVVGYPQTADAPPPRDALECHFMHTSFSHASTFRAIGPTPSSAAAATINAIQQAILNSARANFYSHPTDCPTREKRGWTGDGGHAAETLIMNFGMAAPYRKWLDDIADSVVGGGIPNIAPDLFGNHRVDRRSSSGGDPAWGAGFINTLDWSYLHHGDVKLLERHYATAQGYIEYLSKSVSNKTHGLLQLSYPHCSFGDWCAPSGVRDKPSGAKHTSNILEGFFWIIQLERMARFATVLGPAHSADADSYVQRAALARSSFLALYYDEERGMFHDNDHEAPDPGKYGTTVTQTEQALALTLRVGSKAQQARAARYLADIVRNGTTFPAGTPDRAGNLNVGMVGIKYLLPALANNGFGDVALRTLTNTSYPSFGYMLATGATSLYERWEGQKNGDLGSLNHIMLGSPGQWLFQGLAGIGLNTRNSDRHAPAGWSRFDIFPRYLPKVASMLSPEDDGDDDDGIIGADATHGSVLGPISVQWRLPRRGVCGSKEEQAGQQMPPLVLKCDSPGSTITNVTFASFGTPTGSCANGTFAIDPACDAKTSVDLVRALCLGRGECAIYANITTFGSDPCPRTQKSLAVQLICGSGSSGAAVPLLINASVPFGANASIVFPLGSDVVTEGGVGVFNGGVFKPGVVGVRAAKVTERGVEVVVGGGQYAFSSR